MMYLFEDSREADLSKFFLESYDEDSSKKIFFSEGNGNLAIEAGKLLEAHKEESLVVYIDLIPNNENVRTIYNALRLLGKEYSDRLAVIPLVCAEYYYLRSLVCMALVRDTELYARCVNKAPYWDLPQLTNSQHKHRSYASFEKFCKLLCDSYLHSCCRIPRKGKIKESHLYTVTSCRCDSSFGWCCDISVLEKSQRLLKQYPCVPIGSMHGGKVLSFEEVKELHRKLIKEFNSWSRECAKMQGYTFKEIQFVD